MLKLVNIKKDYYITKDLTVHALKGLNITFRDNEFVSILGPSGCGKTTLLNIIGGLDHYTGGDLFIDGVSTKTFKDRDWDTYRNHSIGFVFQSYNLIPHQTILENVELALTIAGMDKKERIKRAKEALDKVGLKDQYKKKGSQLSGGQCQRVAIARAIVNEPDILLADEPTGALDSETSIQIMDIIKEIAEERLVIMVTHNPDLAEKYSTRIVNLLDGNIISDSNPFNDEGVEIKKKKNKSKVEIKKELIDIDRQIAIVDINIDSEVKNTKMTLKNRNLSKEEKENLKKESNKRIEEFENNKDKLKNKKKETKHGDRKSKLGSFQAFRLSLRNLISKLKRTILVIFAGSIGIIGVSSVLAISQGVTNYIHDMEDDMLSGNPIEISTSSYDLSSITSSMTMFDTGSTVINNVEDGKVKVKSIIDELIAFNGDVAEVLIKNDITEDYVEYVEAMPEEDYAVISKDYGVDLVNNIYTSSPFLDKDDNINTKVMSIASIRYTYISMMKEIDEFEKYASYVASIAQPMSQMFTDEDYILSQYDIVSDKETSYIPQKEDEIMIVLDNDGTMSDLVLAELGYYNQNEFLNIIYKSIKSDKYDESLDKDEFSIDELLGKEFTYYPNDAIYTKNTNQGSMLNSETLDYSTFHYSYDEDLIEDKSEAITLKVTAVLQPKESVSYGSLDCGFYYTEELAEKMIEDSLDSEIVTYLEENITDSGYGKNYYSTVSEIQLPQGTYNAASGIVYTIDFEFEENYFENYVGFAGAPNIVMTMGGSSGSNDLYVLSEYDIGGSTLPETISIYPIDFDNKGLITDYLDKWNSDEDLEVNGKTITRDSRTDIKYTDNLSIIIELINNLINIITYALIAFTGLSLLVSTVMIAIITYVSVIERVKEIGVIRALGGRKKDVSRLFNAETFIIGLASGVFGIAITYLMEVVANLIIGNLSGIYTLASLQWNHVVIMIAVSIVLTLISGLFPAKAAARKDPADALRTE